MNATLLDTVTGKTKKVNGPRSFEWAENNWSCDCNRNCFDIDILDTGICEGGKRFLVIKAEFDEGEEKYTLRELNSDYPKELLDKHLGGEGVSEEEYDLRPGAINIYNPDDVEYDKYHLGTWKEPIKPKRKRHVLKRKKRRAFYQPLILRKIEADIRNLQMRMGL